MGRIQVSRIAERDLPDIVIRPIVTEKATIALERNQYTFDVVPTATKTDIKRAIQYLFDVKVVSVNTHNLPVKKRRVGNFVGRKAVYKRAIVTLADGNTIPLFPEV